MTDEKKTAAPGRKSASAVEEKIDQVEEKVDDILEGTKETIAYAESLVDQARQTLGEGYGKLKTRSVEAYEKASEYLGEARKHLEAAREKMGELYGRSREMAEELYEKARDRFEKVSAEVKKGYAKFKAKLQEVDVKEMRDDVVEYIRNNPAKSLLIALAVGFAVGYLVRPRES